MHDYMTKWKQQADAIHAIFVEGAQRIFAIDGSYALTSDDAEIASQKKKVIAERDEILERWRVAYRSSL